MLKLKYILVTLFSLVIFCTFSGLSPKPAYSAMPAQIQACLKDSTQIVQPKAFKEISKVRDTQNVIYYYIALTNNDDDPLPATTILTVENGKCKNLGAPVLATFSPLTDYVPIAIAEFFTEAKWKSILASKNGQAFIRSISSTRAPDINEMGEELEPVKLPMLDVMILRKKFNVQI